MMAKKLMSLESVLDEERKEVLAMLEGTKGGRSGGSASSASGPVRTGSPFTAQRSPVRSMLDVEPAVPRHKSLPGTNESGKSSPPIRSMLDVGNVPAVRSMLDIHLPVPSATASTKSAQSSPTEANHRTAIANNQHRSLSDAASLPAGFGPRAPVTGPTTGLNPTSQYQFSGYLQSNPGGPVVPKRNTQAGKKPQVSNLMAEVVRGGDLSSFPSLDNGRSHSVASSGIGNNAAKSKSPSNRLGLRSDSPLSSRPSLELSKLTLNDGSVIDMNNAYRRLSDANLASSAGGISSLSEKSRQRRTNSGDAAIPEDAGGGRLEKEYAGEDVLEDSSDEDDGSDEEGNRGRKKEVKENEHGHDPESQTLGMGRAKGPRTARSLMAAAEEERAVIAEKYRVRSLLDPEITVTTPSGEKTKSHKHVVHPSTAFDEPSGCNTPVDSDAEADLTDIKRAQKLSMHMTTITSTPATKRCVRTIYRGDFAKMHEEAHDYQRRVRKYLVATDLSEEAAHALEWTVGTVLRDGDTLLAFYCVDEEVGIANNDLILDDKAKEQVAAIALSTKMACSTPILASAPTPTPLEHGFRLDPGSANASPMSRGRGKTEQERYRAVQDITDRVSKLLRKTKLQVKVVIEVIHCKSPKHLITEVIDYINPTLVILGSRGQSALKGVILGSFSNYLVTKSSVPVMVARKRLRKLTKHKRPDVKLANNLSNPAVTSLVEANLFDRYPSSNSAS